VRYACDPIVAIPFRDASLGRAVRAAMQDYAIIIMAADGTVQSWSEGAETIFGYSASEMEGRPLALLIP